MAAVLSKNPQELTSRDKDLLQALLKVVHLTNCRKWNSFAALLT